MFIMFTEILRPDYDDKALETAALILKSGGVVVIPTETVYGLAANAFDEKAVEKIFKAKGRPQDNPLIVHICEFDDIYGVAGEVPENARALAGAFWPGPLTIVLPKKDTVPENVSAGLPTVAVRMPSHKLARETIRLCGFPLAAPSANISGFPSPTAFTHVFDDMNSRVDAILDGGECQLGLESTVISLAGETPRLLRPGSVTLTQLRSVIGAVTVDSAVLNPLAEGVQVASPGMKHRHYAPLADVAVIKGSLDDFIVYISANIADGVMALCFEGEEDKLPVGAVSMGREDDPFSQARALFGALRELDARGAKRVYARCPSPEEVGLAVCNRLFRAAEFEILEGTRD